MSEAPEDSNQRLKEWCGLAVVFRTFRVAVHPGKIMLALAGLLLTYGVGMCMDAIWSGVGSTVYSGEIAQYVTRPHFPTWKVLRRDADRAELARILVAHKVADTIEGAVGKLEEDRAAALGALDTKLQEKYGPLVDLEVRRRAEKARIDKLPEGARKAAREGLAGLAAKVAASRMEYAALRMELGDLGNQRIFSEWITHEMHYGRSALTALLRLNLGSTPGPDEGAPHPINPFSPTSFLGSIGCMAGACAWMVREHLLYALIFAALNLAIWSLFGGAVCRMAALQAALDRKISMGEALRFSREKWRDFFLAPIIPIAFVAAVGLAMFLGGMLTAVPIMGEIVGTLLFPGALVGGFVIALVVVGYSGGLAMMWPTIGVEGSDSFDAISRSFSYVYNRPWRTILYVLATLVYGGLCYLFIRFFVWLVLISTHLFVSPGTGLWASRPEAGPEMNKFSVMWAAPTFSDLRPHFEMVNLSGAEPFGAVVMWAFVSVVVLTLHAFVISFLMSGFTWIYLLLRREVDATDLEDVYFEEDKEPDLGTPAPAAAEVASPEAKGKSLPVVGSEPAGPAELPKDDGDAQEQD